MNREAMQGLDNNITDMVYYRGVLDSYHKNMPMDDRELKPALEYWTEQSEYNENNSDDVFFILYD